MRDRESLTFNDVPGNVDLRRSTGTLTPDPSLAAYASLVWGILTELLPWPCPLTLLENWLEARAGVEPYEGGFLLHYRTLVGARRRSSEYRGRTGTP